MTFRCNNIQNAYICKIKNGDDDDDDNNDMHICSVDRSIDNIGNDVYVFC